MKTFTLCALLVLLALPLAALEPYLVKDVEPVARQSGSDPSRAVTFDGAAFFFANDGVSGRQLWRSDGTAAGTFQVGDSGGGLAEPWPVAVTERLYFYVWPRTHPQLGSEGTLWVTDGTPAGTLRLTGAGADVTASTCLWVASQGVLYFVGWDAAHGRELWRSDGTPAGTYLVADIRPGAETSAIEELTEYRGRVWFAADDGQHGRALWSSDGIAANGAGTVLAVDPIPSSVRRGTLDHIRVVGDRVTFFAFPPGRGRSRQLWGGDGTARGTYPITRLTGGKEKPVYLYDSVASGNRLYFLAEDRQGKELWVSDGTARGTQPLTGFAKPDAFVDQIDGREINGRFVFLADDGRHGFEAWVTDGTPQGTRLLRDVCPGDCHGFAGDLYLVFGGRLLFAAEESSFSELWSTDGTPEGTRRVSDVCATGCAYWPQTLLPAGDRLFFVAEDDHGWQVWRTDGTATGTARVTDFENGNLWPSDGLQGAVVDGLLLFGADDGEHGYELWRTDGTAATPPNTWLVEDLNQADAGGSFPTDLRPLGDEVVFKVRSDGAPALWKSDGTAAGTVPFRTLAADELESPGQPGEYAQAGGRLFYLGHGYELWRTDGTEAGTFRLTGRLTGEGGAICCEMEAVGSTVFFKLGDEEHGQELWASDGTVAGTRLVLDILPGAADGFPEKLTAFQGKLFFSANGPGAGIELWQSDGTAAGTVPVRDINPGAGGSRPRLLTVHAGRLWFFAEDGEHGLGLWSSDGTEAGTRLEAGFPPDGSSYLPDFMVSLGDRLVFSFRDNGIWASDGTPAETRRIARKADSVDLRAVFRGRLYYPAERTLWSTDGTEAGTGALLDRDGNPVYDLYAFAALGDRLLFTARDAVGQTVLWQSDGTPAGTFPIHPPSGIGNVSGLVRAGDRVFFSSFDPATGTELWAVRP